jgi:hypothetical protein
MGDVKPETEARIAAAGQQFARKEAELAAAETELVAAMTVGRTEAASYENIARLAGLTNTRVFRMLKKKAAAKS